MGCGGVGIYNCSGPYIRYSSVVCYNLGCDYFSSSSALSYTSDEVICVDSCDDIIDIETVDGWNVNVIHVEEEEVSSRTVSVTELVRRNLIKTVKLCQNNSNQITRSAARPAAQPAPEVI